MNAAWWLGVIVGLGLAAVLIFAVSMLASVVSTRRASRRQVQQARACREPERQPARDEDYLKTLVAQRRKAQREYARLLGDGYLALAERQLACVYKLDEEIRKHS